MTKNLFYIKAILLEALGKSLKPCFNFAVMTFNSCVKRFVLTTQQTITCAEQAIETEKV